jgi:hypothetical protein
VFVAQLAIYVLICRAAAARLGQVFGSRRLELAVFALTALNPLALAHATEMLSDLLASALVYLAVTLTVPLPVSRGAHARDFLLSMFLASLATVVRSANVVVIGVVAVLWLARYVVFRDVPWRLTPLVVIASAAVFAPQVVNNYLAFNSTSPFVSRNEYGGDLLAGASSLKYFTVDIPGTPPQWISSNPFVSTESATSINDVVAQQPLGYAATLAMHAFAVLDQDLPFTYVTELRPWYRWPFSIGNFLYLALAGLGLGIGLLRYRHDLRDPRAFAFVGVAAVCAGILAVYLPPHVENRYSLPLYPLLALGVVEASATLWTWTREGDRARLAASTVGVVLVASSALALSQWLQSLQHPLP